MDGRDRRQFPRLEGHFRVDLLNMGDDPRFSVEVPVVEAEALDISMRGMRVKADYNIQVHGTLSIVVYYKGHESICLTEVVWKREAMGEFVYGLFFKEWSKLDKTLANALHEMEVKEAKEKEDSKKSLPGNFATDALAA